MTMGVCGYIESEGVRYYKPNMAALEGELGANIMKFVRELPPPDFTELDKEVAEINDRMRKAIENGTF